MSEETKAVEAEALARMFHKTYEELAPLFGYETRKESAVEWEQVPENNRKLMTAVCKVIRAYFTQSHASEVKVARFDEARWWQPRTLYYARFVETGERMSPFIDEQKRIASLTEDLPWIGGTML